ncbi:MAG TPA: STAS domain-containing protein [Pseudonocardiaceae bacterium]|nr:STAS domain-containing protein [Pseudonocardiaceae bacterium]
MEEYPTLRGEVYSLPGLVCAVSLSGELDAVAAPVLAQVGRQYVEPGQDVVVDVSAAKLVSAAAIGVLCELTGSVERRGHRMVVVATGLTAEMMDLVTPTVLTVVASVGEAFDLLGLGRDLVLSVRKRVDVRRMHVRANIAKTLDLVQDRYRLDGSDTAFALMTAASQRHNVPMRILAGAVLDIREPTGSRWFPGRLSVPAPRLPFKPANTPAATMSKTLDLAMARAGSRLGSAQTVDPFHTGLTLDRQRGFEPDFAETFEHVTSGTACSLAYHERSQVMVADIETDDRLRDSDQTELLNRGVRAVQSTPLLAPDGHCLAIVSTHYTDEDPLPGADALREVSTMAGQVGEWLDWYRRTVVFNALEYLHAQASEAGQRH